MTNLLEEGVLDLGAGRPRSEAAGLPVLRVADVLDGRIQSTSQTSGAKTTPQELGPKASRPGDVVLTTKGTVGRVAIMPPDGDTYAYSPQLCYFRPVDGGPLDRRYLYYWFKSAEFWKQADSLKGQTDMADFISLQDIAALKMQMPPVDEQRAISEVLGALDDKIAANDRVARIARALARQSYNRAVASADLVPMSSVLEPFLGGTPSRSDESAWDGRVHWVSAKDITAASNGVIIETVEGISKVASQAKRLRPLPSGSVVLTARGTVGTVARLAIDSAINQSCYAFEPGQIPAASLTFVIENASAQAKSMAHGSVFDTITMRTFDHVNVPNLSAGQWQRVESTIAPLLDTTRQAVVESARLAKTRDELLPLLMSGKIRVADVGVAALA